MVQLSCLYMITGKTIALTIQTFGHLIQSADPLEKILMLGKIEDRRRRGQQRWLDGITDSMDMNLSQVQEMVKDGEAWRPLSMGSQRVRHN